MVSISEAWQHFKILIFFTFCFLDKAKEILAEIAKNQKNEKDKKL
jgi:hypothetical protein